MPRFFFECQSCSQGREEACYPADQLRIDSDGELVCESCYDDAPSWTFVTKPPIDDGSEEPRWTNLPELPLYGDIAKEKIATVALCMKLIDARRASEAGMFDPEHSGQRGEDRRNALHDAYHLLRTLVPGFNGGTALKLDALTIEACAKFVEQHQESVQELESGSRRYLSKRKRGNLAATAYVDGIRSLVKGC